MEIDHVYETLKMAIYILAAGTGRIQEGSVRMLVEKAKGVII
jgi:hypothetical protein